MKTINYIGCYIKMKSLVLALLVQLVAAMAYGQTPQLQWAAQVISEGTSQIIAMTYDADGNALIAIYHNTAFSFAGNEISHFTLLSTNAFGTTLIKLDPDGNMLWHRSLRGPWQSFAYANNLDTDEDNNIYVLYVGNSSIENASPIGNLYAVSSRPSDIFLVKISPEGEGLWFKTANSSAQSSVVNLFVKVGSDGVYSTGRFEGNINFSGTPNVNQSLNTTFLVKHDLDGNFLWIKTLANTFGTVGVNAMEAAGDGSLYLVGHWNEDALHIDHLSIENDLAFTGNFDRWICKIGPDGTAEWLVREHSSGNDTHAQLALSPEGEPIIISFLASPSITVGNIILDEGFGMVLRRYSISGEAIIVSMIGDYSSATTAMTSDGNGGYFVVGSFSQASYNFGGIEVNNAGGSTGTTDGFLVKMDADGVAEWMYTVGGAENETLQLVNAIETGEIVVAGNYNGADLTIQGGILVNTAEFVWRHFLASFHTVLSTKTTEALKQLLAYPNPFSENVNFDTEALQALGNATLVVFDTKGLEVYRKEMQGNDAGQINLGHLPKGAYVARLSDGKRSLHTKIVKQ